MHLHYIVDASHDPPEIHCIVPQYASEGDSVAIIGTRMHSRKLTVMLPSHLLLPTVFLYIARVTFLYNVDGKDHEVMADINKEFSHQVCTYMYIYELINWHIVSIEIGSQPLYWSTCSYVCVSLYWLLFFFYRMLWLLKCPILAQMPSIPTLLISGFL